MKVYLLLHYTFNLLTIFCLHLFTVVSVVFNLVNHEITKQPLLIPPDPNCRSATLLSDSPFRAPPFG